MHGMSIVTEKISYNILSIYELGVSVYTHQSYHLLHEVIPSHPNKSGRLHNEKDSSMITYS